MAEGEQGDKIRLARIIEELEAENQRQAEALQAIDRIVEDNIKDNGTDINRMNIDGEWFTGPPVDACFRILRGFQDVARAALARDTMDANG